MFGKKAAKSRKKQVQQGRRGAFEHLESRELMAVDVLMLAHAYEPLSKDVIDKLDKTGLVTKIDFKDLSTNAISLVEIQKYDAVFVWLQGNDAPNSSWGNVLADYVDSGGGVVTGELTSWKTTSLQGRWNTGGYEPYKIDDVATFSSPTFLGTIPQPNHPIMEGVHTFKSGGHSYHAPEAIPAANIIANWSDGQPLIVENHPTTASGVVIGLNFWPPSSDSSSSDGWNPSTDGALIMANSLVYAAEGSSGVSLNVSPNPRNTPVDTIPVTFQNAIDATTFTTDDLALTRDNTAVPLGATVTIQKVDDTHYTIAGLTNFTGAEGSYSLSINSTTINDITGTALKGTARTGWTVDTTAPTVTDVVDITPDPRLGNSKAVPTIDLVFSEDIDLTSLTTADVTLTRDGAVVPLDATVTFTPISTGKVRVSGLANFTSPDGNYVFTVNGSGVTDKAGNAGTGTAADNWLAGQTHFVPVSPAFRNVPVDAVDVIFPTPIDPTTFTVSALTLKHYNVAVPLDATITIQPVDATRYTIGGLGAFTTTTGTYSLTINSAVIKDSTGTALQGTAATTWTIDVTPPAMKDVADVTPDPRTGNGKAVPSIDLVFSEDVDLTSLDPADFTLTRDGVVVPLDATVTFSSLGSGKVRMSGLTNFTNVGGKYALTATGYGVKDLAGNLGKGTAADGWLANDPATVTLGGSIVYREGAAPLPLATFATVTDVDTPAFYQGKLTVTISSNMATNDVLSVISRGKGTGQIFVNPSNFVLYSGKFIGQISGGTAGAPLVVAMNANATPAATQALVTSVAFSSPDDFPLPASRRVSFVLEDGEGGTSRAVYKDISIVPVNNAPKLTVDATANYTLNAAAVVIAPAATLIDNDSPIFNTGSLRVSIKTNGDQTEKLEIGGAFTVTGLDLIYGGKIVGNLNAGGGAGGKDLFVRFNLNSTRDVVEQLVKSITFRTVSGVSQLNRSVSFLLRDNAGATVEAFTDVNVGV